MVRYIQEIESDDEEKEKEEKEKKKKRDCTSDEGRGSTFQNGTCSEWCVGFCGTTIETESWEHGETRESYRGETLDQIRSHQSILSKTNEIHLSESERSEEQWFCKKSIRRNDSSGTTCRDASKRIRERASFENSKKCFETTFRYVQKCRKISHDRVERIQMPWMW